ncbi:hypothetical protein CU669_11875 [Paramagnetospirillum kuznetsovii]|uniref:Integrase catalytic domain-containing protein n=1 Tax=Paramagnetospirillum kuznetsovii TaxID=2053833 RepID=A0A364NXG1_9PROT|nr:Mu transposase C-terminal domain-containing protein [Paramagnetospirillum kuznetsovii]RAU21670.1 hypothetical protein CU669_11875 [Paramagnetospirillum kuznetsovii]
MSNGFSFQPGASVLWRGKRCTIVEAVTASSVLLDVGDGLDKEVVPVSKLRSLKDAEPAQADRSLDGLAPEDLVEAKRRFAIIKPLVRCERRREKDVLGIAEANGICRTTIYDWIRLYEGRRRVSDLAPRRKGRKMPKRLAPEVEAIIASVIDEKYLSTQKASGEEVILEVERRCRAARQETKPCAGSIRARLRAVDPKLKVLRREGKKAAHDKFGAVKGNFPGADVPLAVVQIDHTLLDIMVLDEEMRLPIGRPWLTLAIDVFSRMVVGYHLSLDNPGAFAVGLCLCHGMLDKAAELERLGVKGEWPVWGKPRMIHSDNGKDFRSYLIQDTLDEHDIRYEFRPPKTPHYGGHIERLAGTLARKVHALPGATFSNPKQRGEYKSEAKAQMTLRDLRPWLLNLIVGVYHNKVHSGIGCPPLARWNDGIMGTDRFRGIGLPEPIPNPRRLRLDFLPFIERTVQPEGIVWDKIWYRDPLLSQWVRADEGRRRRKFKVRRDPTDISKLYFLDPRLSDYVEIPYRDIGRPSISLWEYRAVDLAAPPGQSCRERAGDLRRLRGHAPYHHRGGPPNQACPPRTGQETRARQAPRGTDPGPAAPAIGIADKAQGHAAPRRSSGPGGRQPGRRSAEAQADIQRLRLR